jgi:hypothetical protein
VFVYEPGNLRAMLAIANAGPDYDLIEWRKIKHRVRRQLKNCCRKSGLFNDLDQALAYLERVPVYRRIYEPDFRHFYDSLLPSGELIMA